MDIIVNKANGFTLIEVVIVVLAIGILAVYPLIKWPGTVINLAAEAERLASDIRYAQSLAMTKGDRYQFVRTSSNTYQIRSAAGTPVILGQGSSTVTLNTGITFGTFVNLPNNLIAFDGTGAPYTDNISPGTALSATASIPITASGNTKTIVITPETGNITIQ
jgi:prepilin-type N-terminal cleavage/methylation domain-containing protein